MVLVVTRQEAPGMSGHQLAPSVHCGVPTTVACQQDLNHLSPVTWHLPNILFSYTTIISTLPYPPSTHTHTATHYTTATTPQHTQTTHDTLKICPT